MASSAMGMIMGMFSGEMVFGASAEVPERPPSPLDELRQAVEQAEAAGVEEDVVDIVRAKLAELEQELRKDIAITVRGAMDGNVLAVVRAEPSDTIADLRQRVLQETGDTGSVLHFVFKSQILHDTATLADAGLCDGSTLQVMQAPRPGTGEAPCVEESMEDSSPAEALQQEATREAGSLEVTVRHAVSSKILAVVRARSSDKVACLHKAVLRKVRGAGVSLHFVFRSRILELQASLGEAGLSDGASVDLVQTPLRCLTASADSTARMWLLQGGQEELVMQPAGPVLLTTLSPDRTLLLTMACGGEGELWCTETGSQLCQLDGLALTGEFSPDGRHIVGASGDETARIWCARTGSCVRDLMGHEDDVKSAAWSPDGRLIVTASSDSSARLWDAETGECLRVLAGHSDIVKSAVFSSDGSMVITASMDCTACVWAVPSGERTRVLRGHKKALSTTRFAPGGGHWLTASFDGTVRLWHAGSGDCALVLPAENNVVNTAVFSPDGLSVLIASGSEWIRLYDASTGECRLTLKGHEDWVRSASFSADGTLITSASYDGTARIWSVATGECLHTLRGHAGAVFTAEIAA